MSNNTENLLQFQGVKSDLSTKEMVSLMSVSSSSDILVARQRLIEMQDEIERLTAENERLRRDYAQLKAMYLELTTEIDKIAEQFDETQ